MDIMWEILDQTPSDQFVQDVWEERHSGECRRVAAVVDAFAVEGIVGVTVALLLLLLKLPSHN